MIHILDNGEYYSDHHIYFVESDLSADAMRKLLALIGKEDKRSNEERGWSPWPSFIKDWTLFASADRFTWFEGKPETLASALDVTEDDLQPLVERARREEETDAG